ncbi:nitroreductase family protein [Elioraea rosea]|uniref:nitroreductase family protein n=1 Tax=Elioraea rosea TaxID=2492390 RepID=UPI001186A1D9|nr:nitroreductase family protein [Elioraea rosea]
MADTGTAATDGSTLAADLALRFGEEVAVPEGLHPQALATLGRIAGRSSNRRYQPRAVDPALVRLLCAVALSAPSKSDLQQADIVVVTDPAKRAAIEGWLPENPWVKGAPVLIVICANNARQRAIHALRGHAYANDHLDPFFNATLDAGIVLSALILAAEAAGLATCPISAIRDEAQKVSDLLGLPPYVFPVAALAMGWPDGKAPMSPRLPLSLTVHENTHSGAEVAEGIAAYDTRREAIRPFPKQRDVARFGEVQPYGWSEDKARQYASPQRPGFGAFVRARGFRLE